MTDQLHNRVNELRTSRGLSQARLADAVGVSRQSLNAVECGRQVPSTALALRIARELNTTVDELFALPAPRHLQLFTPEPVEVGARVIVSEVDGRIVGHRVTDEYVAADAVVVGYSAGHAEVEPLRDHHHEVLVAGCAPIIGMAAARAPGVRVSWIQADSSRALEMLARGEVHLAGIHLESVAEGRTHADVVQEAMPGVRVTVINLTRWRLGLLLPNHNRAEIETVADVLRPGVRCVQRSAGAATQLIKERLAPGQLAGPMARDHQEVAKLVDWGLAETGIAIEAVAHSYGLEFRPLVEERFDLVVPTERLRSPGVARFLDAVDSREFRREAAACPGYDTTLTGQAVSA